MDLGGLFSFGERRLGDEWDIGDWMVISCSSCMVEQLKEFISMSLLDSARLKEEISEAYKSSLGSAGERGRSVIK
jgi:hypothetical protein